MNEEPHVGRGDKKELAMSHPAPTGGHVPEPHHSGFGGGDAQQSPTSSSYAPWSDSAPYGAPPQYQPYPESGAPGYPQQYIPGMNPMNALAIGSLVFSLVGWGLVAVVLGHLALARIARSNGYERGRGLAIAGLVIGYIEIGAALLVVLGIALGITFFGAPVVTPSN